MGLGYCSIYKCFSCGSDILKTFPLGGLFYWSMSVSLERWCEEVVCWLILHAVALDMQVFHSMVFLLQWLFN